jgi:hypothetical protein
MRGQARNGPPPPPKKKGNLDSYHCYLTYMWVHGIYLKFRSFNGIDPIVPKKKHCEHPYSPFLLPPPHFSPDPRSKYRRLRQPDHVDQRQPETEAAAGGLAEAGPWVPHGGHHGGNICPRGGHRRATKGHEARTRVA